MQIQNIKMKDMKQREYEKRGKKKLKLEARLHRKRQSRKSVTFVAEGEPCFCLELPSSRSKEGNKIR